MTEIVVAMWGNVKVVLLIGGLVGLTMTAAVALFRYGELEPAERPGWWKPSVIASVVALALLAIPDIDDLWRARIALIKYQLAAPENVQAATETIERIASKLECKYLGGCEESKP